MRSKGILGFAKGQGVPHPLSRTGHSYSFNLNDRHSDRKVYAGTIHGKSSLSYLDDTNGGIFSGRKLKRGNCIQKNRRRYRKRYEWEESHPICCIEEVLDEDPL